MQHKTHSLQSLRKRELDEERSRIEQAHQSLENEKNQKMALKLLMQRERQEEFAAKMQLNE